MFASLAAATPTNQVVFIPTTGILDQLFHKTAISLQVLGYPNPPYSITLIGIIIVLLVALAANSITERLTSRKVSLFAAVVITILGSFIFSAYVILPFEIVIEGVRLVAALVGAIVIAVFYTLLTGKSSGKKG